MPAAMQNLLKHFIQILANSGFSGAVRHPSTVEWLRLCGAGERLPRPVSFHSWVIGPQLSRLCPYAARSSSEIATGSAVISPR